MLEREAFPNLTISNALKMKLSQILYFLKEILKITEELLKI